MMPSVSVVVLCRDQELNLPQILGALARQTVRADEVIVVDDQSKANNADFARCLGCRYVSTAAHVNGRRNGLRSLARQIGAESARSDLLAHLDGDIIPSHRFLEIGIKTASSGRLVRAPRRYRIALDGKWVTQAASSWSRTSVRKIGFAEFTSDCFVVPRTLANAVGGWDERFEGWGEEDTEFAYRFEGAGLPVVELDHPEFFGTHLDHHVDHVANFTSLRKNARYFAQKHPAISELRARYWKSMGLYLTQYGGRESTMRALEPFNKPADGASRRSKVRSPLPFLSRLRRRPRRRAQ